MHDASVMQRRLDYDAMQLFRQKGPQRAVMWGLEVRISFGSILYYRYKRLCECIGSVGFYISLCELLSKLLKGSCAGDCIGEYYRGY